MIEASAGDVYLSPQKRQHHGIPKLKIPTRIEKGIVFRVPAKLYFLEKINLSARRKVSAVAIRIEAARYGGISSTENLMAINDPPQMNVRSIKIRIFIGSPFTNMDKAYICIPV